MNSIYPQEESRLYITDSTCLMLLKREGLPENNGLSPEEFARNIWLLENEKELWQVRSDVDCKGLPFTWLNVTNSEYIAYRKDEEVGYQGTWLLDMASGLATLYPPDRDPRAGLKLQLYTWNETRIWLEDGSCVVCESLLDPKTPLRNIVRIDAQGRQMWRVSLTPEMERLESEYTQYTFRNIYIYKDGTFVGAVSDRTEFALDLETGLATHRYFPPE